MTEADFKEGDAVRHKAGGPKMMSGPVKQATLFANGSTKGKGKTAFLFLRLRSTNHRRLSLAR